MLTNTSCGCYVSASVLTGESADRPLGKATWLTEALQPPPVEQMRSRMKQALPSFTWFLPFLNSLITIVLLQVYGPTYLILSDALLSPKDLVQSLSCV